MCSKNGQRKMSCTNNLFRKWRKLLQIKFLPIENNELLKRFLLEDTKDFSFLVFFRFVLQWVFVIVIHHGKEKIVPYMILNIKIDIFIITHYHMKQVSKSIGFEDI